MLANQDNYKMHITELSNDILVKSKKFNDLISVCNRLLCYASEASEAREYLKPRIPSFNVAGFTIGYIPNNDNLSMILKHISEEDLIFLDIAYSKRIFESDIPENRLYSKLSDHNIVMPYKNVYGDTIGLVGRTLLSKEDQKLRCVSKYKNTSLPKSLNLFGLYEAKNHIIAKDSVIVVEGQFDCITCHRYGFCNVVALGGATFSKFHFYLLKRYTNNIYLLLDNDVAGNKEREKIIEKYNSLATIKSIELDSSYKDIDEYLNKSDDYSLFKI